MGGRCLVSESLGGEHAICFVVTRCAVGTSCCPIPDARNLKTAIEKEMKMTKLLISVGAVAVLLSFAVSAEAAGNKVSADVQTSCKAQAAKKFSAIHFLKRRHFVNNCVAQHANANSHAKVKPATAGQAVRPTTTGQAVKQ